MTQIIDAHHHLWRYNPREFGWITPDMEALQRNFLVDDLEHELAMAGVEGTVVVQARQSLTETEWLLDLAERDSCIRGVVGWLPLADSRKLYRALERFSGRPTLKGVRHVVQDEPDDNFILDPRFNEGIAALLDTGLVYDILIHARHLPQAAIFAARHPRQIFVLDHIAKPPIRAAGIEPWKTDLRRLAAHENVYCKLSGLVTEADWLQWTGATLRPYLDAALEAFGPSRLMCGSDWPVCRLAATYKRWWSTLLEWCSSLSLDEREQLLGATACKVYQLAES